MNVKNHFTTETLSMKSSMIRELVASTKGIPGLISLAGGFPNPETFPTQELSELFSQVIASEGNDVLQYGESNGDVKLKKEILRYEKIEDYSIDEIFITSGSTNGIYLFSKLFIEKGDAIICEAPSFLGSLITFEAASSSLISVEMDDEGIRPDILEQKILKAKENNQRIKFMYLIPEFQNPTGLTMSLNRRYKIIEIANKYDIPILEDNPYGPLRYVGESLPDLYKIAREKYNRPELVTCVKSFSKVLGPGLRLAYMIGDKEIINYLGLWQQKITISADCVTQRAVANYISSGKLNEQLIRIRDFYAPLREEILSALEKNMPKEIKWTKPEGGMFIWIYLPKHINGDELFELAKKEKISFIPGSKFYPSGEEQYNVIRLNFSYPTKEQIREGVLRLSNVIKSII